MDELLARTAGGAQVEVGVDDRARALSALEKIDGAELAGDGEEGRLLVTLRSGDAATLNRALMLAGVNVHALLPRTGSLEELFLAQAAAAHQDGDG